MGRFRGAMMAALTSVLGRAGVVAAAVTALFIVVLFAFSLCAIAGDADRRAGYK